MNWEKIGNYTGIGIFTTVIVLVLNWLLEYLSEGVVPTIFSFVGGIVILLASLMLIGYLVNKIVLLQHYK